MLATAFVALAMGVQAQVIERFQVRDAVSLREPVLADSINTEGRKYETLNLLGTAIGLNQDNFSVQAMSTDTTGFVTLQAADGEHLIYVVSTSIRADRFMRGKLRVTSPVRWEAFVDGTSRMKKESAEDSLQAAAVRDIPLRRSEERRVGKECRSRHPSAYGARAQLRSHYQGACP